MEKTIKAFLQFVLDDPIMLGLCIAIAILSVLFIVIFIIGKVADKKEKNQDNNEEKLLKTEVDLTVLAEQNESVEEDSEQFTISNDVQEVPVVIEEEPLKLEIEDTSTTQDMSSTDEEHTVETEQEVEPEIVDEPVQEEKAIESVIPSFDDFRIEVPTEAEIKEITQELDVVKEEEQSDVPEPVMLEEETNSFDDYALGSLTEPEESESDGDAGVIAPINFVEEVSKIEEPESSFVDAPIIEPMQSETVSEPAIEEESVTFDETDYTTYAEPQIVESTVNPIDEVGGTEEVVSEIPSYEQQLVEDYGFTGFTSDVTHSNTKEIELPIVPEDVPQKEEVIVEPVKIEESLEDAYSYEDTELPELNVEDFSRTALIRHIPVLDSKLLSMFDDDDTSDEGEDLDLPKLNTSNTSTQFNSLKGESFDITKNS